MFIQFMRKSTDLNPFRRFVMPALALCACAFMVYAAFAGYGVTVLYYLVAVSYTHLDVYKRQAMLLAGGILLLHRGRPVTLRTTCALLLPLLAGALFHRVTGRPRCSSRIPPASSMAGPASQ